MENQPKGRLAVRYAYKLVLLTVCMPLVLAACGYNPQNTVPNNVQQCNTLKRQMLFGEENVNVNTSQFQSQAYQNQRYRQYNKMNCYKVLKEAKEKQTS